MPALVCRTGYTGEDGVELLLEPGGAGCVGRAARGGARPAGLGARDTLRLEVCYPLYGNDLSTDRTPIEAGLKWACALDKEFVGAERLREQAEQGTAEKLAPFVFTGPGIPRQGCDVCERRRAGGIGDKRYPLSLHGGRDRDGLCLRPLAEPGTDLTVDVRGKERPARVSSKPLYKKETVWLTHRAPPRPIRTTCSTTPSTTGPASRATRPLRHHLVRAGRARRGRLLRPAGRRHECQQGQVVCGGRVREGRVRRDRPSVG